MAERLFPIVERTGREIAARARADRDAQTVLFVELLDHAADPCPACAGVGAGCTCDETGAVADSLFAS